MKDIRSYMREDDNYIEKFTKACDGMIQARYILADSKISAFLQVVAGDVKLYSMFKELLNGFDFSYEWSKSKQPDGYHTYRIVLPHEPKKTVAYVFSLLYAFDTNAMSFKDFLHEFYYSETGANDEYSQFVDAILVPFRELAVSMLYEGIDPYTDADEDEDMTDAIRNMLDKIAHTAEIDTAERKELTTVTNALASAICNWDTTNLAALFIGCRNTVRCSRGGRGLMTQIAFIERRLREYGIPV